MNAALMTLAFVGGVFTFFSPCSFPMLPSYVSYSLSLRGKGSSVVEGLKLGLLASLGLTTVYLPLIMIQALIFEAVSEVFPLITMILGFLLVIYGFIDILNIYFLIPIRMPFSAFRKGGKTLLYLYGLAYALASLPCSAPVAFMAASISLSLGLGAFVSVISLYLLGLNSLMIAVTLICASFKQLVSKLSVKLIPYFRRVTPLLLIASGTYIILFEIGIIP